MRQLADRPEDVPTVFAERFNSGDPAAVAEVYEVRPRHVYTTGDLALLIVDWVIDGTDSGGRAVHIEGTATDVARRGEDGRWRYVIDNPFGTRREDQS